MNKLGLSTNKTSIKKTEIGYTFKGYCKQKDCRAAVNLKIDVKNGMGTISYEEKCKQHH